MTDNGRRLAKLAAQALSAKSAQYSTLDTTGQVDLKRLAGTGAINLGTELPPGEYAFQVVVADAKAKGKHRVATQWIDFEIVK
ncbi:MAG TPA: hypothetical protein VIT88_09020 [Pyrinomonadaceae bacterium]